MIRTFEITLISLHRRIVRTVIAHNSIAALRIALAMMPELNQPCGVTCKVKRIAVAA